MTIDMKKLEESLKEGLNGLRGLDFEQAENLVRRKNATVLEVSLSKEFQARLAGMALKVPYEDIAELPLKQYAQVCQTVFNFLFSSSDEETPVANSEV